MLRWSIRQRFNTNVITFRADSRFAPSQWETPLQSNAVSQWLGASLESSLTFTDPYLNDGLSNRWTNTAFKGKPYTAIYFLKQVYIQLQPKASSWPTSSVLSPVKQHNQTRIIPYCAINDINGFVSAFHMTTFQRFQRLCRAAWRIKLVFWRRHVSLSIWLFLRNESYQVLAS